MTLTCTTAQAGIETPAYTNGFALERARCVGCSHHPHTLGKGPGVGAASYPLGYSDLPWNWQGDLHSIRQRAKWNYLWGNRTCSAQIIHIPPPTDSGILFLSTFPGTQHSPLTTAKGPSFPHLPVYSTTFYNCYTHLYLPQLPSFWAF